MTNEHRKADEVDYEPDTKRGLPRWAKIIGIVLIIIVLAFIAMTIIGGGEHGPWQHGGIGPIQQSSTPVA